MERKFGLGVLNCIFMFDSKEEILKLSELAREKLG